MASFLVGRIEITPAANAALEKTGLSQRDFVARHQAGAMLALVRSARTSLPLSMATHPWR